jgi:hypothetical protein
MVGDFGFSCIGLLSLPIGTCLNSDPNYLWQRSAENIQGLSSTDADRGASTPFLANTASLFTRSYRIIAHMCTVLGSQLANRARAHLLSSLRVLDIATIVSTMAGEVSQHVSTTSSRQRRT